MILHADRRKLITGASAPAHKLWGLERHGVRIVRAGEGAAVDGRSMVRALADLGFNPEQAGQTFAVLEAIKAM